MNFHQSVNLTSYTASMLARFGSVTYVIKSRGKFHPRAGPDGQRAEKRYRSTLCFTLALYGVGGQHAALFPGMTQYLSYGRVGGPRAGIDRCGKSRPHRDSIPGSSSPYRVAIPTTLSRPTRRTSPSSKASMLNQLLSKTDNKSTSYELNLMWVWPCTVVNTWE
jgi:hypothetical protein